MLKKIVMILIYLALLPTYIIYPLFTNIQGQWY